MMSRIANALVILTCLAAITIFAARTTPKTKSRHTNPTEYKVGQATHLIPTTNQKTLVIGLWSRCSVCKHDLPLYQRLAKSTHIVDGQVKVVEVFPPLTESSATKDEIQSFAKQTAFPASVEVPKQFPFTATPTLVLMDADQKVLWTWKGALTPNKEKELHAFLD